MIEKVILISLICTGVHIAFASGNVLGWLRVLIANLLDRLIGKKFSLYIQKPLYGCLPCMASVWGLIFGGFNLMIILAVCGLNVIIARSIEQDETVLNELQSKVEDIYPTLSRQNLK